MRARWQRIITRPTANLTKNYANNIKLLKAGGYSYTIIERRPVEKEYEIEFKTAKDNFEKIQCPNRKYQDQGKTVYIKRIEMNDTSRVLVFSEGRKEKEQAIDALRMLWSSIFVTLEPKNFIKYTVLHKAFYSNWKNGVLNGYTSHKQIPQWTYWVSRRNDNHRYKSAHTSVYCNTVPFGRYRRDNLLYSYSSDTDWLTEFNKFLRCILAFLIAM